MEQLKQTWEAFLVFLRTYDSYKIMEIVHELKWEDLSSNPYVWLVGIPGVGYLLIRRRFKALILLSSMGGFLYLLKITLPASGESIPFDKLMTFIGGCVALIALNLYVLLIRGD